MRTRHVQLGLPDSLKRERSEVYACGHCGNRAEMVVVHQHSRISGDVCEDQIVDPPEGLVYELLECPSCSRMTLRQFYWASYEHEDFSDVEFKVLFPVTKRDMRGIPNAICTACEAAEKVRTIDANAFGVLVGRVLEMVCEDKNAQGKTLYEKLNDLANRGDIPTTLSDVAHGIRGLRNIGAHATLGELSSSEIPLLDGLLFALLEYLYRAPNLVAEAKSRLDELKAREEN